MATYVLTIAGVTKTMQLDSLRITETVNSSNRLDCVVWSNAGAYRPAIGAEVILTEDGTRIFGGIVDTVSEAGQGGIGWSNIANRISALDFNSYATRRFLTARIQSGTLKAALQVIDDYLTDYGVTLDGAQVDGPTLDALQFDFLQVGEALNQLSELSEYTWEIDYNKVLRMTAPSSVSAPFNLVADDGKVIGDLTVEYGTEDYANRVIVRFTEEAEQAWAFISPTAIANGETITIGSTEYTWDTVLTDEANHVKIGATIDDSLTNLGLAMEAADGTGQGTLFGTETDQNSACFGYILRTGMFKVVARDAGESGNNIDLAEAMANASWYWEGNMATSTLLGGLDEALTNWVQANNVTEQGTQGIWEAVFEEPDIRAYGPAQDLAEKYLLQTVASRTLKRATYTTEEVGIHPGQTQTITLPDRGLSGTFVVTDVEISDQSNWIRRRVTVQGGTTLNNHWLKDAKRALGSGTGGGTSGISPGGGTGGGYPVVVAPSAVIWFGGGEELRTRVTTASTWYRGRNGVEAVLDSYKLPATIDLHVLMIADAVTGGNAQCRVVAGSGDWTDQTVVSGSVTPVTDGANWVWQSVTVTPRVGVWAYRIEMTSSVNASDVGFRAYLTW